MTEGSDTALESHNPDTGDASSWSGGDATSITVYTATGAAQTEDDVAQYYIYNATTPPDGDYKVDVYGKPNNVDNTRRIGALMRWLVDGSGKQGYLLELRGNGDWNLYEYTDDSAGGLANGTITGFETANDYKLTLSGSGTTISYIIRDETEAEDDVNSIALRKTEALLDRIVCTDQ
jgi:hypothetical protein